MSHKVIVSFFALLLVLGLTSSAYAGTGKPHKGHHVKKTKKVKKPHHRGHCR